MARSDADAGGSARSGFKQGARRAAERLVAPLARTGLTPNGLTVIGFLINVVAGVVIATGGFVAGGIIMLIGGAFDTLDGALARVTGRASVFGEFFDSTMDRFSEAVVFLGVAVSYLRAPAIDITAVVGVALSFAAMIGSIMVSYARARAEGLDLDCEVGWLQRPERIVILGVALLLPAPFLMGALVLLAVLTHVTVAQRIAHVRGLTVGK
ncbi:MAG TPA: CDP-alcohol phosphatidyltransferase family protein [Chloroflexota bacterium]|nr:CDP-alcohol phosphatidyltransferase family protein [Chloroflexota bacterium]